jgi:hypothetical protein
MRLTSPVFIAALLIAAVRPRWTGYGAGRGASLDRVARTYSVCVPFFGAF